MAVTLTKSALELKNQFVGCSQIALAPIAALTAITFDDVDVIYTLKDSITFNHTAPTKTEINVDQFDDAIRATYEKGEFSIEGDIPSVAEEILNYFFETNDPTVPVDITGFEYKTGIDLNVKVVRAMVKITNKDNTAAIVIPNCEFVVNFSGDSSNNSNPLAVHFTATPMANLTAGAGGTVLFYGKAA